VGVFQLVLGFTMVKVSRGHEDEAYLALKNTKGVIEAYRILGDHQIFVILQAENAINLCNLVKVMKNISCLNGIWHILVSSKEASKQLASINESLLDDSRSLLQHSHQTLPHSDLLHALDVKFSLIKMP
jgi:hypothetical protein